MNTIKRYCSKCRLEVKISWHRFEAPDTAFINDTLALMNWSLDPLICHKCRGVEPLIPTKPHTP